MVSIARHQGMTEWGLLTGYIRLNEGSNLGVQQEQSMSVREYY